MTNIKKNEKRFHLSRKAFSCISIFSRKKVPIPQFWNIARWKLFWEKYISAEQFFWKWSIRTKKPLISFRKKNWVVLMGLWSNASCWDYQCPLLMATRWWQISEERKYINYIRVVLHPWQNSIGFSNYLSFFISTWTIETLNLNTRLLIQEMKNRRKIKTLILYRIINHFWLNMCLIFSLDDQFSMLQNWIFTKFKAWF